MSGMFCTHPEHLATNSTCSPAAGGIYVARCEACSKTERFSDYDRRAEWVGKHRVKTGHTVVMETDR